MGKIPVSFLGGLEDGIFCEGTPKMTVELSDTESGGLEAAKKCEKMRCEINWNEKQLVS